MARLNENPGFTGTIANIVVYTRWGNHYIRTKSTLTGKRVKKDPAFKKTMAEASILAKASRIASKIYQALPNKLYPQYRQLTGMAQKLLRAGKGEEEVEKILEEMVKGGRL